MIVCMIDFVTNSQLRMQIKRKQMQQIKFQIWNEGWSDSNPLKLAMHGWTISNLDYSGYNALAISYNSLRSLSRL